MRFCAEDSFIHAWEKETSQVQAPPLRLPAATPHGPMAGSRRPRPRTTQGFRRPSCGRAKRPSRQRTTRRLCAQLVMLSWASCLRPLHYIKYSTACFQRVRLWNFANDRKLAAPLDARLQPVSLDCCKCPQLHMADSISWGLLFTSVPIARALLETPIWHRPSPSLAVNI